MVKTINFVSYSLRISRAFDGHIWAFGRHGCRQGGGSGRLHSARSWIHQRNAKHCLQALLWRLEDENIPGQGPVHQTVPPTAGWTHQPPGPGCLRVAWGGTQNVSVLKVYKKCFVHFLTNISRMLTVSPKRETSSWPPL